MWNEVLLDGSSFLNTKSIFDCFMCASHCCNPLAKAVRCGGAVVYFGLGKLAKNAKVCENCMLGLINQDLSNQKCTVFSDEMVNGTFVTTNSFE